MYNTINSYYNYTSWKSSFNIINILILPINTGKNYLKYSNILPLFVTTSHYESNFLYCEIRNFMMPCRDKLYHHTISNKIKFTFLIISSHLAKCSTANLCLCPIRSQKSKEWLTLKDPACNHTLLNLLVPAAYGRNYIKKSRIEVGGHVAIYLELIFTGVE